MDLDVVTELTSLALDLDTVVQELLKIGTIEDLVSSRFGIVDDELVLGSNFSSGGFALKNKEPKKKKGEKTRCEPTEKITQQSDTAD